MELPDPTTGALLTCCAIQVTADAVSRVIHVPNGGNDRMTTLQARIGGRHLTSVAVYGNQPRDTRSIMWFNDEQADSTPINVIAAIIAVDRRPLVRGTVAFTGAVTPAGNITTVDHGLVEQIRDLTIAEFRLGSDREKTMRFSLRGRRPRPAGRLHAVDLDGQALCGATVDFLWEELPWHQSATHRNAHQDCVNLAAR
jgi:hypothetical protein